MMLNSRFELSKIEKNTRVEREICLATLENREWKENLFLPLSKIESRKRIVPCHSQKSREKTRVSVSNSRKSRVEREFFLSTLENREWKENFLLPLSKIESRKRNGKYQIFEIEREISLSTLDFSLESETLVNACTKECSLRSDTLSSDKVLGSPTSTLVVGWVYNTQKNR